MNRSEELKEVLLKAGRPDLAKEIEPMITNCKECNAKCCRYVMLELPPSPNEFSYYEYLIYQGITLLVDEEEKSIDALVTTNCVHIGENNTCKIYDTRPEICRGHANLICFEQNNDLDYIVIKTIDDLHKNKKLIEGMYEEEKTE